MWCGSLAERAGWGYFDFRMKGEGYADGYQSVPVDWTISSPRKAGFFRLLAEITGALAESDEALTLAAGLNFFFRAPMEEDAKVLVGIEVSRAYYALAAARKLEPELVAKASPLLAALLSTELERVRLESVDAGATFDSQLHERERGSSAGSSRVARPLSFLGRVVSNGLVRYKARVVT